MEDAVNVVAKDMENVKMDEINRPYDKIKSNGEPQNPIEFDAPKIDRGRRDTVLVWNSVEHEQCHNVLFRDDLKTLTVAYWSVPGKEYIKTIMGYVQICHVLRRCTTDESESESENDSEIEDDDIVFQLTDQYVAVKVNNCKTMESLRNRHAEDPLKEIAAMQWIGNEHPHVIGCFDVLFDGVNINVVMPFCTHGDLFGMLQINQRAASKGMDEDQARLIFRQLMSGIQHLQRKGICHRDLSPENIMLDDKGSVIIDMGMSLRIPYLDIPSGSVVDITKGQRKLLIAAQGTCGKLPYMAPEIYANSIRNDKTPFDGEAVDIWSSGTILFCMLSGNRSYHRAHRSDSQYYWMTRDVERLLRDWNLNLTAEAVSLLKGMLQENARDRITLDEILNHPWLKLGGHQAEENYNSLMN